MKCKNDYKANPLNALTPKFSSIRMTVIENAITIILAPFLNLKNRCRTVKTTVNKKGSRAGNTAKLPIISP